MIEQISAECPTPFNQKLIEIALNEGHIHGVSLLQPVQVTQVITKGQSQCWRRSQAVSSHQRVKSRDFTAAVRTSWMI